MNLQQAVQLRSSDNGFGRLKGENDFSNRVDHRLQPGKFNQNRVIGTGVTSSSNSKDRGLESPSRDRLVYLTTCLIGHHVEVQVKNGSVYSGIFHATNADKDFGVILKMARLTKDVSFREQKSATDSFSKAPSRTLIIPSHELVQVLAKDLPITSDGLTNEVLAESQQDIMIDSYISQSRHVEAGRELEPWMPDENVPQAPELDNIFDSPWTGRSWDQFKVNETLFGVKSTFNEELYTTKLEKGPRMRELEAMRIAREIEGEETHDLHLAEERGVYSHANFDIDEETKYSSVYRGFDDSGCADEDVMLNSHDMETFGESVGPAFVRSFADVTSGKNGKGLEGSGMSTGSSPKEEIQSGQVNASEELYGTVSLASDHSLNIPCGIEDDSRAQNYHIDERGGDSPVKDTVKTHLSIEEDQPVRSGDLPSFTDDKRDDSEKTGVSSVPAASSIVSSKVERKTSICDLLEDRSGKLLATEPTTARGRPGSLTSSTSEGGAATSAPAAPGLSPSSSMGSLSSEKSTLNPNAKEFKFNPSAKSFVPTQSPLRPVSPVNDSSFYFPANMPPVPHIHGLPVGIGVGPSFAGHQPVLFNPQAAAMHSPQPYFPGNTQQYGQQMILGHPRQVMYMPGYPAEMAHKGRDF